VGECTDYILRKLRDNDFVVRYTHPNLVFISWAHWIPGYVRQEYKKQTGTAIDGYGNLANSKPQIENNPSTEPENPNDILFTKHKSGSNATNSGNSGNSDNTSNNSNREYNSTKNYKPAGIYNNDIMQKIQDKFK